ncbi:hypothetical protein F8M41_019971 [Gigaspora margarita]|uniref:Uncharacterized protein n=1 Tax=Gigaspora margarita TaxID=4874 RepID=A0A8H4AJB3_GIGMA|nr:hypothetical protein F8M41_019971 [Gigaspora margarita]
MHVPNFVSYPEHHTFLREFIFGPAPSSFVNIKDSRLYQNWNIEALINFKWNAFAKFYHLIIWAMFIAYFVSFIIVATASHKDLAIPQDRWRTAHPFYIFLCTQQGGDDDPNDPWNLSNNYHQKFEIETISPNIVLVQTPNSNTNMYADFRTALIAMYMVLEACL